MDPNAALRELQAACAIMRIEEAGDLDQWVEAAWSLHDAIMALDGWLSRGGFLPDAWRPQSRVDELKSRGGF